MVVHTAVERKHCRLHYFGPMRHQRILTCLLLLLMMMRRLTRFCQNEWELRDRTRLPKSEQNGLAWSCSECSRTVDNVTYVIHWICEGRALSRTRYKNLKGIFAFDRTTHAKRYDVVWRQLHWSRKFSCCSFFPKATWKKMRAQKGCTVHSEWTGVSRNQSWNWLVTSFGLPQNLLRL